MISPFVFFGWKHHSVDKGLVNQPLVKGHTHTTQLYHQNMTFTCGSTIKLPNFPLSSSLVSEIKISQKNTCSQQARCTSITPSTNWPINLVNSSYVNSVAVVLSTRYQERVTLHVCPYFSLDSVKRRLTISHCGLAKWGIGGRVGRSRASSSREAGLTISRSTCYLTRAENLMIDVTPVPLHL